MHEDFIGKSQKCLTGIFFGGQRARSGMIHLQTPAFLLVAMTNVQPTEGRSFFNTFFASALDVANLEDPSLAGKGHPNTSLSASSKKETLDCGSDPGPSLEEMQAYTDKTTKEDGRGDPARIGNTSAVAIPARSGQGKSQVDEDTERLSSSMKKRLQLEDKSGITDDTKATFEAAIERRLAVMNHSSRGRVVHDASDALAGEETDGPEDFVNGNGAHDNELSRASRSAWRPMSRVGSSSASGTRTPVTDKDGLGWPAKGSLHRLHSTPHETAQTQAKLSAAVKTILECLGEDPEREGLKRTPERYAKALLWMTRGYEERLSGKCFSKPMLVFAMLTIVFRRHCTCHL